MMTGEQFARYAETIARVEAPKKVETAKPEPTRQVLAQPTAVQQEWYQGILQKIEANKTKGPAKANKQPHGKLDAERVAELEQDLQRAKAMIPDFVRYPSRYPGII